jgi:hypothetical protein
MARSPSLRSLVEELAAHSGVELSLEFRRQRSGKHAQSFLDVRGIYVPGGDGPERKVTGVSGEVVIPWVAYGDELIGRLAHELEHVRILLTADLEHGSPEEEQAARRFESLVRSELEASLSGVASP